MASATQLRSGARVARLLVCVLPLVGLAAASGCGGEASRGDAAGGAPGTAASGGAGGSARLTDAFGCRGELLEPAARAAFCGASVTFIDCFDWTVHIVVEGSEAMQRPWGNTTRWEYVRLALSQFGKFELFAPRPGSDADVCDSANCASPLILDGAAGDRAAFLEALDSIDPSAKTPLLPMLDAALARTHETPGPVIVLTASAPDECPSDVTLAELARAIMGRTGVAFIALGASYDVDPLASAAGTLPFPIGPDEPVDRLVGAIGLSATCGGPPRESCGPFEVPVAPPDHTLDLDNVHFGIETEDGQEYWPRLSGPDACASSPKGGSYLDTSQTPSVFRLCPCSCARMTAGMPIALFGCKP